MVKTWINGFLARHRARLGPADWPAASNAEEWTAFAGGWITALSLREVTEFEADEASKRLTASPPAWRRDHIPAILAAVEAVRKERGGPGPVATTREAAEAGSKDCDRCGGSGLTTVWHPHPDPDQGIPASTAAYCVCPAGRWVENVHRTAFPDVRKRFADLADVRAGRSRWRDEAPDVPPPAKIERGQDVTKPDTRHETGHACTTGT